VSISETGDLLGFSSTTGNGQKKICGLKYLVDARGQRRIARLVQVDRKTTLTQITTGYLTKVSRRASLNTTCQSLEQMG